MKESTVNKHRMKHGNSLSLIGSFDESWWRAVVRVIAPRPPDLGSIVLTKILFDRTIEFSGASACARENMLWY